MLELVIMKSEKGLYVGNKYRDYTGKRGGLCRFIFPEVETQEDTHLKGWKFFKDVFSITTVLEPQHGYDEVNILWVREDLPLLEKLPETITVEEACEVEEKDYEDCKYMVIGSDSVYAQYAKYYTRTFDKLPRPDKEVEFTITDLGTISVAEVSNFKDMKITTNRDGGFGDQRQEVDLSSIVEYSELEQMLVPDLALHNRPCKLSQDNTYKVIRNYVRSNINLKYASISSNYDFCFTVKKRVSIKPYIVKTEIKKSNNRSYAKPRFSTVHHTHKSYTIFEMCPAKKYGDYTPVRSFYGDTLEELTDNIRQYLDELMTTINIPLQDCECCNGTGVIKGEIS